MRQLSLIERLFAWLPLVPLLVLLAGTYWLTQQVRPLPIAPDYKSRHDPDLILEGFSAQSLDRNGEPHLQFSANRLTHYPDDDSTELEMPYLISAAPGKPAVHISSVSGKASRNGDELFLSNGVQVVREASATRGALVITTPTLHVVPDDEQADTDQPITVTDAHGTINAVGMRLDNKAHTLELLAQVRGHYEPVQH